MDSLIRSCLIWASLGGLFLGFESLAGASLPCCRDAASLSLAETMQVNEQSSTTLSASEGSRIESDYGDARAGVYRSALSNWWTCMMASHVWVVSASRNEDS